MVAGRARRGKGRSDDDLFDRDPFILAMHRAIDPVGQTRDDYEIFSALAERLGYRDAFTEGRSSDEWVRLQWENSRASLARRGIEAPDFETFWEQGYFRMPEPEAMQARFEGFPQGPSSQPARDGDRPYHDLACERESGGASPARGLAWR
ncbi:hypothetical protein [Aerobium aerolatum]|uniref:Biotin/methionine sulfoxide reductase n=1 Tax=Aquamicrobium aerolatum DSM 21857 TaxID=1121003 RepID=A0A1I3RCZ0_9HYPH|nr:hypothetical protein [Aquamicrobium aerolatum]SFJ43066.1 biotin/methionine sulfoxide reductase [Aquamicrobium aerolatum DSM 21857]